MLKSGDLDPICQERNVGAVALQLQFELNSGWVDVNQINAAIRRLAQLVEAITAVDDASVDRVEGLAGTGE